MRQGHRRPSRAALAAWVLFDWSYGGFTTIVATFVMPTYVVRAVAADPAHGSTAWAASQAVAGLAVAVLAAPLGAMADRSGRGRALLGAAWFVMVLATAGFWTVLPHSALWWPLALNAIAATAFEVALVFYNAMLPGLASPARLGRLSMLAWGAGYAGGLAALGLCVLLLLRTPRPFGLDPATAEPVRACALFAACWLAGFGWPVLAFGPAASGGLPWREALREGLRETANLLRGLRRNPLLGRFLLARIFYVDGLTTLFIFGGIFASAAFGFSPREVAVFGIGLTATAGLGVLVFAGIEDRVGSKATVLLCLMALAVLGAGLLIVQGRLAFWILGLALGVFVGPVQAASRSLMARIAPPDAVAAHFGLLALSGRATAFAGPALLSVVLALTGSLRAGMASIVACFVVGGAILATMPRSPPAAPG